VINWMLEVEDVEDVACTVDDIEATDRSQSLVQRGWSEEGRNEDSGSSMGVIYSDSIQTAQGCGVETE
jgi:hypothetical protein